MKPQPYRPTFSSHSANSRVALLFVVLLAIGNLGVFACQVNAAPVPESKATRAQDPKPDPATQEEAPDAPKITNEQLDSLVAPIALYPDPLLSQILVASTYPLEIVQLQQWLDKTGSHMNEKAKAEAVQKQEWDPSIQAMAVLPEVVKRLSDSIKWTADLGNAFLAQQADVMDAIQRMRVKAKDKGTLQSTEQMKVETKEVESKTVVVIEQSDPEVVYVPAYDPMAVWGAMPYAYPPYYYPPYAGRALAFGIGVAIGAAWGGGGWGWGCGWGGNDININRNNTFNRNTNISGGNRTNIGGGNKWQHNPQHRGGAPYSNRATANKFGGSARGDSLSSRQQSARQNSGQLGGGDRGGDRGGGDRGGDRGGSRGSSSFGGGGGDKIGSRETSRSGGGKDRSSSSFGSGSFGGGSSRSSSRGSSSMGSRGGGGFSRGGGGGMRGGGGRR